MTADEDTFTHLSGATINLDDDPVSHPVFHMQVEWDKKVEEILLKLDVSRATMFVEAKHHSLLCPNFP